MALDLNVLLGAIQGFANAQHQQNLLQAQQEITNRANQADLFQKIFSDQTQPNEVRDRALQVYMGIKQTPYTKPLPPHFGKGAFEYLMGGRQNVPSLAEFGPAYREYLQGPQAQAQAAAGQQQAAAGQPAAPAATQPQGQTGAQAAGSPAAAGTAPVPAPAPPPTFTAGGIAGPGGPGYSPYDEYLFSQLNLLPSMTGTGYLNAQPGYAEPLAALPVPPPVVGSAAPLSPGLARAAAPAPAVTAGAVPAPAAMPGTPGQTTPPAAVGAVSPGAPGFAGGLLQPVPAPPPLPAVPGFTAPRLGPATTLEYDPYEAGVRTMITGRGKAAESAQETAAKAAAEAPYKERLAQMQAELNWNKFQGTMAGKELNPEYDPVAGTFRWVPRPTSELTPTQQATYNKTMAQADRVQYQAELDKLNAELKKTELAGGGIKYAQLQLRKDALQRTMFMQDARLQLAQNRFDEQKRIEGMNYRGVDITDIDPATGQPRPVLGALFVPELGGWVGPRFAAAWMPSAQTKTRGEAAIPVETSGLNLKLFAMNPEHASDFGMTGAFRSWLGGKIGIDDPSLGALGTMMVSFSHQLAAMYGTRGEAVAEQLRKSMQQVNSPEAFAAQVQVLVDDAEVQNAVLERARGAGAGGPGAGGPGGGPGGAGGAAGGAAAPRGVAAPQAPPAGDINKQIEDFLNKARIKKAPPG